MSTGLSRCESIIERTLGDALISIGAFAARADRDHPSVVGHWPAVGYSLCAQPPVAGYRPDFGVAPMLLGTPQIVIAVEADGHEFHERTQLQAQRDKSRDRWLQANHVAVLRFTGREIVNDADMCAREVLSALVARERRAS